MVIQKQKELKVYDFQLFSIILFQSSFSAILFHDPKYKVY